VEALTGYHPDRLREEQDREMTIVLGFAWLTLPSEEEVGIVDVPGHRDFIENMLSGVGAIDAVLFVVAADEGVMPQTREHLAILDLLNIQGGVVALTKLDKVDDPEWVDLVEIDLKEALAGTVLESAPIVRVSGKTGAGIDELIHKLDQVLVGKPHRPDLGRPRLSADRIFTLAGFGTIVTGTLLDGHFQVGDDIVILPKKIRGRIRGLQTHKRSLDIATPGSRTAINISGVDVDEIQRGDVIVHLNDYKPSQRLDVFFRFLADINQNIKHNMEVKFFIGAAEVVARLRLLGVDRLHPGSEGWLQLELKSPVVAVRGDRYILRRPSPGETLGGGEVVDPHPEVRHKRFSEKTLKRLEALKSGTPEDVLYQLIQGIGAVSIGRAITVSSLQSKIADRAIRALIADQRVVLLDLNDQSKLQHDTLVVSSDYWDEYANRITHEVYEYLRQYPLRAGMPREELKSRMRLQTQVFAALMSRLKDEGLVVESGPLVHHPGHEIQYTPDQKKRVRALLNQFSSSPNSPPTVKDSLAAVGDEIYNSLINQGVLVPVSSEVIFRKEDYQQLVTEVRNHLKQKGTISVAELRDHLKTSRRYVLALLEYLDDRGITVREGDVRRLKE
jgi:selenocysteine-specific elongation factor